MTSCWYPEGTFPEFADYEIETLWPNRVGVLRRDPRRALPFLASTFENHSVDDADVVICSSSGWAHRVQSPAPKIVYCYNPARWLYQPHDYLARVPPWVRNRFVASTRSLRSSDLEAAQDAHSYLVTSTVVANRVRAAYGIEPAIVPPARGLSPEGPMTPVRGIRPGFLLTIARPRAYKHTDVVCEAMALLPRERLVVVGGDASTDAWPLNVHRLSQLSDAQLRWLYANAAAVVAMANEDFGLTLPEAQGFGLPAVALRGGGYLDTTVDELTGIFVDEASPTQIAAGVARMREHAWEPGVIRRAGEYYSPAAFAARMHAVVAATLSADSVTPIASRRGTGRTRRERPQGRPGSSPASSMIG
ncbi:glycosyltransferase [Jatrophihabitans sp.]|uniref:glycosyltransferase n=1 Tax=Jatrophihabitans sp. TaxID=1932789 RepID=UPI0030C7572F